MRSADKVPCYVHGTTFPRATCHQHHEAPRYTGGSDSPDNLMWLCANCHNLGHRVADLVLSNRVDEAEAVVLSAFDDESQRKRLAETARHVVDAHHNQTEREFAVVQFEIDPELYRKFKLYVHDHLDEDGRRMSIRKYFTMFIESTLRKKGML